jgi:hypothetical protein
LTLSGGNNGLAKATVLGKVSKSKGVNPLFKEALILTIFCKPSAVKCSLRCIIMATFLNNK